MNDGYLFFPLERVFMMGMTGTGIFGVTGTGTGTGTGIFFGFVQH